MSGAADETTVASYMTSPVSTITPGTGLKAVAARLRAQGFSGLPVVDGSGRVLGVLSEADLLIRAERPAVRREGILACQVMSRPAVTIRPDATITEAAYLMHRYGLKRLLVVNGTGRPEGVVSRGDLLRVFLRGDAEIRRDLLVALGAELRGVSVTVQDGVVTLRGTVDGGRSHRLSYLAERVDGVVAVRCVFTDESSSPVEVNRGAMDMPVAEIETLSEAECLELLRSHSFGRLALTEDGQPQIFPVNYAADSSAVVFRTSPGMKLASAPMSKVAFEIDDVDHERGVAWSVVMQGVAQEITHTVDLLSERLRALVVEPMAPGEHENWIAVIRHGISGRRFHLPPARDATGGS